ncbi:MAG: Gfo/Idh/MocA family oxidoreductase [Planctomycetota bacterium]
MRLKLGLIGLSKDWRQRHLPALHVLQDRFEVAGVYNAVSSLAGNVAREFDARSYDGFREMLASPDTEALLFLENGWYGTNPINAACDFGKAIYCGSEIELAPERATSLRKLVESSGVAFMAEYPRRLAPASLRLKELIATRLGDPQMIFCHKRLTEELDDKPQSERMDRELKELMDWCSFIAGAPIRSIQASSHFSQAKQCVDYCSVSIDLSREYTGDSSQPCTTTAQISCGSYIPAKWSEAINFQQPSAMQVCCENGLAFLDLPNSLIWFDDAGRHQESLESELNVGQQLLTQFHRSVTSLVRKMADLEDICQSLQALQLARESLNENRRVSVL